MKGDPGLVAGGAVILERKLDFQPNYFEQTLRVRILSQAGMAAVEITDLPPNLLSLEGQVTQPDGKVQVIGRREDFLVRKVVSTADGSVQEGVLIPPGVTADCVVEVRWREATERGRAEASRMSFEDKGHLPERCGDFYFWSLGSAYPTQVALVQRSREMAWPFLFFSTNGYAMAEGSGSMGSTYLFRNLPALPSAPFSLDVQRPVPKVLFYRPIDGLSYLAKGPAMDYWQKVVDLAYKNWFLVKVAKGEAYRTFSAELRKDLAGGPRERARTLAERLAKRTVNLDQLLYDEKPDLLARHAVDEDGVSNLNYAAKTGFVDNNGVEKLLFHLLLDEGLKPKVALVADRRQWVVNPEVRTPFQFTHQLLGVEEPGQPILWLDPLGRMVPAGEVPYYYQGTKALTFDGVNWKAGFQEIRFSPAADNGREFAFQVDLTEEVGKVRVEASFKGAPAFQARRSLGKQSPTQREAWFKGTLEKGGLTVTRTEVAHALDLSKPLVCTAEATLPVEPGRILKVNPFPGMDAALFLPASLAQERLDPIILPFMGIQEARSTVKVPRGYVLPAPVVRVKSTQWGTVLLEVRQDPASGDLTARMKASTLSAYNLPAAYGSLKDYLQAVRAVVFPEVTLEKSAEPVK
ncbi:hypothetical protein [Mesoterricola silvestris]|nr:hypothetical protein [Mesoterricola silvestris]